MAFGTTLGEGKRGRVWAFKFEPREKVDDGTITKRELSETLFTLALKE
jgi:hypothetical protein